MRGTIATLLVISSWLLLAVPGFGVQGAPPDEVSPRITRLETWLQAVEQHRPGVHDDAVRVISAWNQEQLQLIWIDALTVVSLVREPGVSLFFVTEPGRASSNARQVSPIATNRSIQVRYAVGELRRLRAIARQVSPTGRPGPENDIQAGRDAAC